MANQSPYRVPPITDPLELLDAIRDSLKANRQFAIDGLTGDLQVVDALQMIKTGSEHMLAVVNVSKDTL